MVCIYCKKSTKVTNTRPRKGGWSVWRRRWCPECLIAFTTLENIPLTSVITIKNADGSLRSMSYGQIFISVHKALGASQQAIQEAEYLTSNIIDKLFEQQQAVLSVDFVQQQIFETLTLYQPKAGQRYQLEEIED